MAAGIDMSLDDIMRRSAEAATSRRRFSFVRSAASTTPYPVPQARQRGMFPEMGFEDDGAVMIESGTKLLISNLDYGVSNGDIKGAIILRLPSSVEHARNFILLKVCVCEELLFSEEGELKRYSINYDQNGRSKGTAEVVFMRHSDALSAIKKYNYMRLDGKPLQIELVRTSTPVFAPLRQNNLLERPTDSLLSKGGRVGGMGFYSDFVQDHLPRGSGKEKGYSRKLYFRDLDHDLERSHRFSRGHAKVKSNNIIVTAKDLDDDLERYHLEAKAKEIITQNGKSDNS